MPVRHNGCSSRTGDSECAAKWAPGSPAMELSGSARKSPAREQQQHSRKPTVGCDAARVMLCCEVPGRLARTASSVLTQIVAASTVLRSRPRGEDPALHLAEVIARSPVVLLQSFVGQSSQWQREQAAQRAGSLALATLLFSRCVLSPSATLRRRQRHAHANVNLSCAVGRS